uniref:Uncharacterized protein n=1 Tax=Wuchereria bancrofti TaxID=6293 RepID=A0AAF5Q736_WUCBA
MAWSCMVASRDSITVIPLTADSITVIPLTAVISLLIILRYHKDQNMAAIVDLLNGMLTPNISFAAIA